MRQKTVCALRAGFKYLKKNEFLAANALFEQVILAESRHINDPDYKKVLRAVAIAYDLAGNRQAAIDILTKLRIRHDETAKKILDRIKQRKREMSFDPLRLEEGVKLIVPAITLHSNARIRLSPDFKLEFQATIRPFEITQAEIGEHIEVTPPTLSYALRGENTMSRVNFEKIMEYLKAKGVPEDKITELRKIALGPDAGQCLEKTEVEK